MESLKQFDNLKIKVVDDLKTIINKSSQISIAASCFSIYAFDALKKELSNIKNFRFIYTSPTFSEDIQKKEKREFYIPKLNRERSLYGSDFEIKLRNRLSQQAIAKECAQWIQKKAEFKTNISNGTMNGSLIVTNFDNSYTYIPFNDFTTTGIGLEKGNNLSPAMIRMASPMAEQFLKSFNDLWLDSDKLKDITSIVVKNIVEVYKENSPDFIYFVTVYNIFREFLEDLSEDVLPNEASGFKQSEIWKCLYNFQKDAALAIINKLEKYNGCILADSVGLGKTFTALAVIKYYENRNKSVLVLCPKKLQANWNTYKSNYINNPLTKDRLRYDVLFHTDLSRDKGESNGINLEYLNWSNYDLIVIDESHNFRNGGRFITSDTSFGANTKENRYLKLMNKAIRAGVKTKVLMLSATPINNNFNDLKNQIQFAYEGDASKINNLLNIKTSIDEVFRQAQHTFSTWSKRAPEERTTKNLLNSLSFDFFQILDAVTIARSRKHITRYYDTSNIGSFPERLPPISRNPSITTSTTNATYTIISKQLDLLNLSIYTPSFYILPSKISRYTNKNINTNQGLSLEGREKGIRKLMAINLLKRLESSVNSFRLTLNRIQSLLQKTIDQINVFDSDYIHHKNDEFEIQQIPSVDLEDEIDEVYANGKKLKIRLSDMDYLSWKHDIEKDLLYIDSLLNLINPITPDHDNKLQTLLGDIRHKLSSPINKNNRKIIIFTEFADTAEYLFKELSRPIQALGLNAGLVTGSSDNKSTIRGLQLDFNKILTLFSPISKRKSIILPNEHHTIDILIATDCISEGQDLQDCDYIINYDIHWNPVRLIQRFGRIDRIGSMNHYIQMVNYWPDVKLDEYINLRGRVESRMKATVLTSTGDDNFLTDEEKGDLEYRREQLRRLQNEIVDLEDMDTGINILDLGLNEFRMDLLSYMKHNKDLDRTPYGMFAIAPKTEIVHPGVIFVLKNRNNDVNINNENHLHPFYMVYLDTNGKIIYNHLSPKQLLDTLRSACKGLTKPIPSLCEQFDNETNNCYDMSHYSHLLQLAIKNIIQVKERSDIASIFRFGESTTFASEISGLDDFELICFLVIK